MTPKEYQRKRLQGFSEQLAALNSIISPDQKLSKEQILARTVASVTGTPYVFKGFSPSIQNAYKTNMNGYTKERNGWAKRKNQESYKKLKDFILKQNLVSSRTVLTQGKILEVVIDHLNSRISVPPPSPVPIINFQSFFRIPMNPLISTLNVPLVPPVPFAFFPIVPFQNFAPIVPKVHSNDNDENDENEEEEIIDIIG